MTEKFTEETSRNLGHYVYRLIDPRNGRTFYIGKGQGNRVFAHVLAADKLEIETYDDEDSNELPLKLDVITKIRDAGLQPIHIIHRHGMSRESALEVEAALIDATPGLTNIQSGHGSNERGPAHVDQLAKQYGTTEIEFNPSHKLLLIKIRPETVEQRGTYEGVRRSWRINTKRAKRADYVLAIVDGICCGVFVADTWQASKDVPGRYEFDGPKDEAPVSTIYNGKRIPRRLRKPGMASPILYEGY